ncbi:MAG: PAS domain-containing protein [Deltaproteobacteria bacterium]|nr:PAS domain-containing protein [Deltaproteobacteria bacterium]
MLKKPTYEELEKRVQELESAELERGLIEKEHLMVLEVLQLINETERLDDLLGSILHRLKHWSGCEAVAIRLKDGPDFPYFVTSGFPDEFVKMERYLCSYKEDGEVERDRDGNPLLECMCGNILCGRFDPSKNFFTADGSFWSNCTTRLLATTTDADRQARTRNRCNSSGYESVALIPLRSAGETFGLIQLNDHREGRFSPDLIAMYRRVADSIAGFLAKRQAQEALRKSEMHLRILIDTLPDLVWLKDPDGVYLSCNARFERFFGAREAEIVGKTDYDFVDKELADFFREKDRAAMAAGKPCVNEEEITFPDDGHHELLETIKAPIYDREGRIAGVLGIARDITPRKQAELMLKESEAQLRLLIKHTPAAIAMFDREMRYLAVSSRWISDYRLGNRDIIGRSHYEVFPEIPDHWKEVHRRGMNGEVSRVDEECFKRMDGTIQWLLWEVRPWYKSDNSVGGIVILTEDITNRKQAEAARNKLHDLLVQARKMESVGRLAGGVAHDLNNLLSPILGYSDMLLEDLGRNDNRRESVNEILNAGNRARDLVRQLLAFSRKQTLEFKAVDINETIEGFRSLLRRTIPEDIVIKIVSLPGVLPVMADVGQMEQVIMNLAVNAADAMRDGGALTIETTITDLDESYAETHPDVSPGQYVMLAISDTGHGMDEETRKQIFEPFFSTKGERGTGLGLATVYGIVKQHAGNIWVYSEPGNGTTFKIYLPIAGKAPAKEDTDKKAATDLKGSETILLVEDNEQVRRLAETVLTRRGYTIISAQSSEEAQGTLALHHGPLHLLLTDVVMPGLNGRELYEKLSSEQPSLKVLYMSGYTDNVIAHRGVLDEGVHFIQKPFSNQTLAEKVRKALDEA